MSSKTFNLLSSLGSILVIAGALLKILHLSYGNMVLLTGFIIGAFASYFYIDQLKHKIKQLEQELASRK